MAVETGCIEYNDVVHLPIAISTGVLWYLDDMSEVKVSLIRDDRMVLGPLAKEGVLTLQRSSFAFVSVVSTAALA